MLPTLSYFSQNYNKYCAKLISVDIQVVKCRRNFIVAQISDVCFEVVGQFEI